MRAQLEVSLGIFTRTRNPNPKDPNPNPKNPNPRIPEIASGGKSQNPNKIWVFRVSTAGTRITRTTRITWILPICHFVSLVSWISIFICESKYVNILFCCKTNVIPSKCRRNTAKMPPKCLYFAHMFAHWCNFGLFLGYPNPKNRVPELSGSQINKATSGSVSGNPN